MPSAMRSSGIEATANSHPAPGGLSCPSNSATGGTNRKTAAMASPLLAPAISHRLLQNDILQTGRTVLRQAKALAVCAKTTVAKAAPEAAGMTALGKASPGRHPAAR